MPEILITSYENPDLDGTACAIGYAEFLQKTGHDAVAGIFGTLHKETVFVLDYGDIPAPLQADPLLHTDTKVILVDASDISGISQRIDPLKVVEIIDHRKIHQAELFPNAAIQIELVGSAATLVAEKYYTQNISISEYSALLLYGAIISNTVNFQATVTTDRDKKMASWLEQYFTISSRFAHDMFVAKSQFTDPLKTVFEHDFALIPIKDFLFGIVQLEIVDVAGFITTHSNEIKTILRELKKDKQTDFIFLTAVDVEEAMNYFVIVDDKTELFLDRALSLHFSNGIAQRSGILMRKQITPLLLSLL